MSRFIPGSTRIPSAAMLALGLMLSACGKESCTQDDLSQKATALMTAAQAFGATNPDRMAEVGPKVADLVARSLDVSGEFQPICDEIDALIAEIGG